MIVTQVLYANVQNMNNKRSPILFQKRIDVCFSCYCSLLGWTEDGNLVLKNGRAVENDLLGDEALGSECPGDRHLQGIHEPERETQRTPWKEEQRYQKCILPSQATCVGVYLIETKTGNSNTENDGRAALLSQCLVRYTYNSLASVVEVFIYLKVESLRTLQNSEY